MNKGIVMEVKSKHLFVMTSGGQFIKLSRKTTHGQIGEEIEFSEPRGRWINPSFHFTSALAAAVIFGIIVFSVFGGFGNGQVVAYYTLDINPGIELGVNDEEKVIKVRALNKDGAKLLDKLNYKNQTLENVTQLLMEQIEAEGLLVKEAGDIVITSTVMKDKAGIDEQAVLIRMEHKIKEVITRKHPKDAEKVKITSLSTPREVRANAIDKGVSTGKLAVKLIIAKSEGTVKPVKAPKPTPTPLENKPTKEPFVKKPDNQPVNTPDASPRREDQDKSKRKGVTIQELKDSTIQEIVKDFGGMDELLTSKKSISKEEFRQLLEDDEDEHEENERGDKDKKKNKDRKNKKDNQENND
ncbi:MAG TPA: anti-sigma factor domain-containing protein [Bacilli bacterium]